MKTIDEIVAMLRDNAALIEEAHRRELALAVAAKCEVCDQVAVAKSATTTATCKDSLQVGNVAAMRKALQRASIWFDGYRFDEEAIDELDKVFEYIEKALSAPARNCDLYATEAEAYRGWQRYYNSLDKKDYYLDFEDWLFAEAKGTME